ncbi:Uncharacterised protein [Yersinia pseudotuberculosis]|nr:Uncharacterised protein [Yersinia pseudotuberculosis]
MWVKFTPVNVRMLRIRVVCIKIKLSFDFYQK